MIFPPSWSTIKIRKEKFTYNPFKLIKVCLVSHSSTPNVRLSRKLEFVFLFGFLFCFIFFVLGTQFGFKSHLKWKQQIVAFEDSVFRLGYIQMFFWLVLSKQILFYQTYFWERKNLNINHVTVNLFLTKLKFAKWGLSQTYVYQPKPKHTLVMQF